MDGPHTSYAGRSVHEPGEDPPDRPLSEQPADLHNRLSRHAVHRARRADGHAALRRRCSADMRPQLQALADAQGGVVTRRQAARCGYSERELKTLTGARGDWVVVRRGAYAERPLCEALDDDGRYRLRVMAAALTAAKHAVLSHASAAALQGLPLRPRWRELVHVTRPGVTGGRTEGGVKHHLAGFDVEDVDEVHGVPVLRGARTAVDIGREFGFEDGVVAADAALRGGATRAEMERCLARMRCWPRVTAARAAVEVADGGAQSVGETLLRLLVLELGIGRPQTQFEVVGEGRRAFADLRVGRHLFEFDGRVKYLGRGRGGVAEGPVEDVLWDEKLREDWLRRQDGGYGVSRVVWTDLFGPQRAQTKRRLAQEYADSARRFGHLA